MADRPTRSATLKLIRRAEAGDETALAEARVFIETKAPKLWLVWGDLAAKTQKRWVRRISESKPLTQEGLERQLAELRSGLTEDREPSPLEKLLIDLIVVRWLQLHDTETGFVDALGHVPLAVVEHKQRLLNQAQRSFTSAIKSLAQVRRLLTPVVQINVARQQVNVAGSS